MEGVILLKAPPSIQCPLLVQGGRKMCAADLLLPMPPATGGGYGPLEGGGRFPPGWLWGGSLHTHKQAIEHGGAFLLGDPLYLSHAETRVRGLRGTS